MKLEREPIWWLPLLRRVVIWGLVTMVSWGFLLMILLSAPLLIVSVWAMPQVGGDPLQERAKEWMGLTTLLSPYLCGFVVGASSGFYAPPTDASNPFFSRFNLDVTGETLISTLVSVFVLGVSVRILLQFTTLNSVEEALIVIPGFFVLFALSLWRTLNRALDNTKKTNAQ